jgi:hypothetical protein
MCWSAKGHKRKAASLQGFDIVFSCATIDRTLCLKRVSMVGVPVGLALSFCNETRWHRHDASPRYADHSVCSLDQTPLCVLSAAGVMTTLPSPGLCVAGLGASSNGTAALPKVWRELASGSSATSIKLFSGSVPRWAIVLDVRVNFIPGPE